MYRQRRLRGNRADRVPARRGRQVGGRQYDWRARRVDSVGCAFVPGQSNHGCRRRRRHATVPAAEKVEFESMALRKHRPGELVIEQTRDLVRVREMLAVAAMMTEGIEWPAACYILAYNGD